MFEKFEKAYRGRKKVYGLFVSVGKDMKGFTASYDLSGVIKSSGVSAYDLLIDKSTGDIAMSVMPGGKRKIYEIKGFKRFHASNLISTLHIAAGKYPAEWRSDEGMVVIKNIFAPA